MTTPIVDFVRAYAGGDVARFHMPGHKGKAYLGVEPLDITEVKGADVLYNAAGIIAESEANATALFGTAHTFYSTEGSTLAIKAMLFLAISGKTGSERPLIFAGRNAHKAFLYGCALLDIDVRWLSADETEHLLACTLTASDVERALAASERLPEAVYLTSPDYLGNVADVAGIAAVCHRFGVPLLVDNAHGAYLRFLTPTRHPIDLGADMTADSAHKTLPVLTGGAYLHISKNAPKRYLENARSALSLFASTSPSYLILQSLDLVNKTLAEGYAAAIGARAGEALALRARLKAQGLVIMGDEPLKLTVNTSSLGYRGDELADLLRERGIEVEFADPTTVVMMLSADHTSEELARLEQALVGLPSRPVLRPMALPKTRPVCVLSPREALFAPREEAKIEAALGRICAEVTVSCPPAVPPVMCGERIDDATVAVCRYYGVESIAVVKR